MARWGAALRGDARPSRRLCLDPETGTGIGIPLKQHSALALRSRADADRHERRDSACYREPPPSGSRCPPYQYRLLKGARHEEDSQDEAGSQPLRLPADALLLLEPGGESPSRSSTSTLMTARPLDRARPSVAMSPAPSASITSRVTQERRAPRSTLCGFEGHPEPPSSARRTRHPEAFGTPSFHPERRWRDTRHATPADLG